MRHAVVKPGKGFGISQHEQIPWVGGSGKWKGGTWEAGAGVCRCRSGCHDAHATCGCFSPVGGTTGGVHRWIHSKQWIPQHLEGTQPSSSHSHVYIPHYSTTDP